MPSNKPMEYKPFSQACENNKVPILDILKNHFSNCSCVLEIGSGTGQHAVFFAEHLTHLCWQTSDRDENISGIKAWLDDFKGDNLPPTVQLDVLDEEWPHGFDAVFSANTAHIMPWSAAQEMIRKVATRLPKDGIFALYGPFNYGGQFTSESNRGFDLWLKERAAHQGIRDFEKVNDIASENGLKLIEDHSMPANNRTLIWQKL